MDDNELKRAFAELRTSDRGRAPAFGIPVRPPFRVPLRLAAGLSLFIVAGALSWHLLNRRAPEAALASWRAPTDVLLSVPGVPALDSMPDVTASLLPRTTR